MAANDSAPKPKRKPVSWLVLAVTYAIGAYLIITAFERYDPKSPICQAVALVSGVEQIPKSCKLPLRDIVIAIGVLGLGSFAADKLNRRS